MHSNENEPSVSDINNNDILNLTNKEINLSKTEKNCLYNIAGYIMNSIKRNQRTCKNCIRQTGSKQSFSFYYNRLTLLKRREGCNLFFVNPRIFKFFLNMEIIFRKYYDYVRVQKHINLKQFFVQQFNEIDYSLPTCHNLKTKMILRFHAFRLKIKSSKVKSSKSLQFASKSMAMHARVK